MLPTSKTVNQEFTVLEPGVYEAKLVSLDLEICTEYQSDLRYQGIQLTYDLDGEKIVDKFVKVSMNERAKLYERLSSLFGKPISEQDNLEWVLSPKVEVGLVLDKYKKNDDETFTKLGEVNDGMFGHVDDLRINGDSFLGKVCQLQLIINKSGYNRVKNSTPLPKVKTKAQIKEPAGAPA